MKKVISFSPLIFSIIFLFLPMCKYFALIFDYNFELFNELITSSVITLILLITTISIIILKVQFNKTNRVFSSLILLLTIICEMFFVLGTDVNNYLVIMIINLIVACACSFYFLLKLSNIPALMIACEILSVLLIFVFIFLALFKFSFGDFNCDTIIKSFKSPENTYIAEVIDSDQGALGGNTIIEVRRIDKNLNILIGEFIKLPKRVYSGKYQEYINMSITWNDENTLVINGVEYKIEN